MPRVVSGLERLLERPEPVRGMRVGLVVNPASVTSDYAHASVALHGRRGVRLAALFGPEHGIAADAQDLVEVGHSRDRATGLPVFSLYGETRVPTPAMLDELDAMVFDVQDVGARYYTFVYTMLHVMQACARDGKRLVVLDRPNPLGGEQLDGNLLEPEFRSFVGMHPLVVRHGMTTGELALLFRAELGLELELVVVRMKGWRRAMHFDETGLPWVMTSPNIPTRRHRVRLPGRLPGRGHQPLGRPRHDAAVRARGRAVARRCVARARARARAAARRALPRRRSSSRPSRSTRT